MYTVTIRHRDTNELDAAHFTTADEAWFWVEGEGDGHHDPNEEVTFYHDGRVVGADYVLEAVTEAACAAEEARLREEADQARVLEEEAARAPSPIRELSRR